MLLLGSVSSSFMAPQGVSPFTASAVHVKMAASAAAEPETVRDALVKLFSAYDTSSTGTISLEEFTSKWVAGRGKSDDEVLTDAGQDWEARQARAGARRIKRLFTDGKDMTLESFVGHFQDEYEKRIERGLSTGQATAEIVCNMPQQALFAEMYGTE